MRVDLPSGVNLAVWKRAAPKNRMRETFTSGSVGGLAGNSGFYLDSRRSTHLIGRRGAGWNSVRPVKFVGPVLRG